MMGIGSVFKEPEALSQRLGIVTDSVFTDQYRSKKKPHFLLAM